MFDFATSSEIYNYYIIFFHSRKKTALFSRKFRAVGRTFRNRDIKALRKSFCTSSAKSLLFDLLSGKGKKLFFIEMGGCLLDNHSCDEEDEREYRLGNEELCLEGYQV